jgi:hypothetical protein
MIFLMTGLVFASPDFVNVEEGQPAPISGKILTSEALAEIISQHQREIDQCKIDADFDFKKYQANQELKYELLQIKYDSEVEMYQSMILARDSQIKKDKKRDVWQRWATYGAFALGVGTTVAITYSVNQTAGR